MKKIALLLLFFSSIASAQIPHTNRPDLIQPLVEGFKIEAQIRGVDVNDRLSLIDSIMVIEKPENKEKVVQYWAGDYPAGLTVIQGLESDSGDFIPTDIYIHLEKKSMESHEGARLRLFYHELGHVFGLKDCGKCHYNIMYWAFSDRAASLFRDEHLIQVFIDMFFEAIEDPEGYNQNHTHY